ncbi:hypothetical protein [Streptomyces regalis]|uniref:Uncharacterized protein n=1 Tax=Streptomyces regalis TaxID=68262 RepID=A0A117MK05_9ACTN|nr:hypothetical protein [Streptomyces regalis]KUL21444.1 hypothetical protein ADL12_44675 [Streptomyces regalis]
MTTCVINDCTAEGKTVELGQVPGSPALALCSEHSWDLFWHAREKSRKLAAAIQGANPEMAHTPGYTYVIRLNNGNVKLGFTADPSMKRLRTLSGKANDQIPVQILAVMRGGESLEAVIQNQWGHLRVQGRMEEFHPDPSLLQWASEQGITPEVSDLEDWLVNKHNRGTATSEETKELQALINEGRDNALSEW